MTRIALLFFLLVGTACSSSSRRDFYEGCNAPADCLAGTTCTRVAFEAGADGAMCTASCTTADDCPFGGACFELVGDPREGQRVCYQSCRDDIDCSPNFVCAEATMMGAIVDRICLPL